MKKITLLLLTSCFIVFFGRAQTVKTNQSCNPYFLLNEGSHWTTETYNNKDKFQGEQTFEVLSVEGEANNLTATVKITAFDKKKKETMNNEIVFTCKDGVLEMDMSQYIPADMEESMKEMDFEIEVEETTIPEKLAVGQKLNNGSVTMKVNGMVPMNMKTEIVDRKVVSQENINVPAGNFSTFKITSTIKSSGMVRMERKNVEFIAEGFGVVRSETYNRKGELGSYSVLSSYRK